jgi:hypothetical protein
MAVAWSTAVSTSLTELVVGPQPPAAEPTATAGLNSFGDLAR